MKDIILGLFVFLPFSACAAEQFTAAELKQIEAFQTTLENSCREQSKQMEQKIQALPERAPAFARLLSRLTVSDNYCACASRRFSENITPDIVRHGTEEQGAALVKRSGTECVLPKFKSLFEDFCFDMVSEIRSTATSDEVAGTDFCRCLQSDLDSITVESFESFESFEAFVSNSLRDYRAYRQTRQLPNSGSGTSLVSSMQHCGLDEL